MSVKLSRSIFGVFMALLIIGCNRLSLEPIALAKAEAPKNTSTKEKKVKYELRKITVKEAKGVSTVYEIPDLKKFILRKFNISFCRSCVLAERFCFNKFLRDQLRTRRKYPSWVLMLSRSNLRSLRQVIPL
jgi:hypothetical protein